VVKVLRVNQQKIYILAYVHSMTCSEPGAVLSTMMSPSNFSSDFASLLKGSKSPTTTDEAPTRWSQPGVSHPAAVVIPSSEKEIISVLRLAATKKLQVIPMAGAHSPFVPITDKSVVLDMRNFRDVSVRPGSVTFGGGSTAGDVIKACAAEQCYTCKLALRCQDLSR
jgi:FAD/FMN-containing dehydrogenase